MKEKIFSYIILAFLCIGIMSVVVMAVPDSSDNDIVSPVTTISEDYIPSETILESIEFERVVFNTVQDAEVALAAAAEKRAIAIHAHQDLLALGYADDHPAVIMVYNTITNAELYYSDCEAQLIALQEKMRWETKYKDYPTATKIWLYMKNQFNWSDEVCAGIMGNIMAEVGGGTFNFKLTYSSHKPYGLFQWLGGRKILIHKIYGEEVSIENQLEFMYDELYGTDGVKRQVKNDQREKILNSTTPEKAAKRFCDWFERPGGTGIERQRYARIAYKYFTS